MAGTLKLGQALAASGPLGLLWHFLSATTMTLKVPTIPASVQQTSMPRMTSSGGCGVCELCPLYPSIYLPAALEGTKEGTDVRVQHRVAEAFRVVAGAGTLSCRCCPYLQLFYDMTNHFLSPVSLPDPPSRDLPCQALVQHLRPHSPGALYSQGHLEPFPFTFFEHLLCAKFCAYDNVLLERNCPCLHGAHRLEGGQACLWPPRLEQPPVGVVNYCSIR